MTDQPIEPQPVGLGLGAWDGPEPEEPTDAELFGLWPDPFTDPPGEDGERLAAPGGAALTGSVNLTMVKSSSCTRSSGDCG